MLLLCGGIVTFYGGDGPRCPFELIRIAFQPRQRMNFLLPGPEVQKYRGISFCSVPVAIIEEQNQEDENKEQYLGIIAITPSTSVCHDGFLLIDDYSI